MIMKVDLHLHSSHSKRSSQWVLQKIGCPESFSQPSQLYQLVRQKGMDMVTLTDHNTLGGCLDIAHLEGVFLSEEVTAYFPEDGCKVHVLVWDINEAVHGDLMKARQNVFELIAYLQGNDIMHALAHPLFSINNRLKVEHFEKLLLLFKAFELNGARDGLQNRILKEVLDSLNPPLMERLMAKHGLVPGFADPWQKVLVAGSDDHSSLNPTRMYTEVADAHDLDGFWRGLATGRAQVRGRASTPLTLAHNLYAIGYQFAKNRYNLERYTGKDMLMRFLDQLLQPASSGSSWYVVHKLRNLWSQRRAQRATRQRERFQDVLRRESQQLLRDDPELNAILRRGIQSDYQGQEQDELWFSFVNRVANQMTSHLGGKLVKNLNGANLFSAFDCLGAGGALFFMLSPYFVSFGLFARDRLLARSIQAGFSAEKAAAPARPLKVAHFTDTFFEVNGVARTLREQALLASRTGKDLTILTCAPDQPVKQDKVRNFAPVAVYNLPEYQEQRLCLPPLLELMRHVFQQDYTYLHAATPGPMGLAALKIAQAYNLPISGTYHTQLPQYAAYLTGDQNIEELTWRYTIWFYDHMESIYVPSKETGEELISRGLDPAKVLLYPRGVNVQQFNPAYRSMSFRGGLGLKDEIVLLYVGRISKEKDLPVLEQAFQELCRERKDVHLVVVGEGPYLEEMRRNLHGWPASFTGYLHGADLAQAYASSDVFVFPSTTDTFGNVILEAQASGLPVVVSDRGGPQENMLAGTTGLVVEGKDALALGQVLAELASDRPLLRRMGCAARAYMEKRSFENAFLEHWQLYGQELEDAA
jgi:glycosyltransferase involved in cell wall biosynthesis